MIPGQKKLNVTYDTLAVDFDAPEKKIIGETCMDIQMAEDYADALLADEETITRKEALEIVEIILCANEHLKHREYCFDSIKGFREVKEGEDP